MLPPFWPPRSLSVRVQSGWSLWPQEWGLWGLFISNLGRAQCLLPPAIVFVSEYLFTGDRLHLLSLGSIHLLPQISLESWRPQEIFTGKMKGEGLSFVSVSGCHGAYTAYLVGVMEMLLCPIKGSQGDFFCYFSRICCGEWSGFLNFNSFIYFLAKPQSIWDLSSLKRNWTCTSYSGSTESYPLDHQESP